MAKKKKVVEDFVFLTKLPQRLLDFLVTWLHLDYDDLLIIKHLVEHEEVYREVRLPKGNGEQRVLFVPGLELKAVQRKILDHALSFIPVHFSAYGCRNGVSFIAGAKRLAGFANSLYTLDLRHAFPSVTRRRVEVHLDGPLRHQLNQFGYPLSEEEVNLLVQVIVDLVIFRDSIPQGAPTSPALLNIVCLYLDKQLTKLLADWEEQGGRYRYVRYVDDLSFGAENADGFSDEERKQIKKIIETCGFHPHPNKEFYIPNLEKEQKAAEVTGVRIHRDGRLTLSKDALNRYRARLHHLRQLAEKGQLDKEAVSQAHGLIGYLNQVYGERLPSSVVEAVKKVREVLRNNDPD